MIEKVWDCPEIFRILVSLPQNPLRNLNVYVIRTPQRSLIIDTGFCCPQCRADLWAGLEHLGLDVSKTALFLTHLHSDHTGLVWDLIARGLPVYMGRAEYQYSQALWSGRLTPMDVSFMGDGFPHDLMQEQTHSNQARRYAPRPGFPAQVLADGASLWLGDVEVQAVQTPGHTPGHMVLYLPREQLLFSGDHILFDITPNISIWPAISNPLADYVTSLEKIRRLPIQAVFPAHRTVGGNVYQRIDQLLEHHCQRLDEIYRAVAEHPGSTAYALAGQITWSARGIPWDRFPPHQRWFALGETLAHLRHLIEQHKIVRQLSQGRIQYFIPKTGG